MVRLTLLLAVAVALSSFGVLKSAAAAPAKSPEERFSMMDKDGNKKLSLDEFVGKKKNEKKEKAEKRFKKLDKDSDSALSLEEFKAGIKPKK